MIYDSPLFRFFFACEILNQQPAVELVRDHDSKLSDALLAAPSDMQSLQLVETH